MFSRQKQGLLLGIICLLIATTLLVNTYSPSIKHAKSLAQEYLPGSARLTKRLHLLLPATNSNLDFCKFLLSSTITGYPDPILIGWGGHGAYNGKESHLFKVSEGLAYLNSVPPEQDDDLVLMLDAYDIWMLLRPEVIISRYNEIIKEQATWLEKQGILGKLNGDVAIENTLIFGADKVCWPRGNIDPGCWSPPPSPLREQAYGPDTDSWMVPNRPRWLNSGTLIGPLGHMREMFNATMENIHRTYDGRWEHADSDQYYFQDVWSEQELTRMKVRDGEIRAPVVGHEPDGRETIGFIPDIPDSRRTEYRLSVDFKIDLFQTAAGFTEYLAWMSFNNTTPVSKEDTNRRRRIDELELPQDVLESKPPFETQYPVEGLPATKGWKDVVLGVNVAQQTVWPLFHVTGEKAYRERWWHYLWFTGHAEALLKDVMKPNHSDGPDVIAIVDGVQYIAADTSSINNATASGSRGGGWSDVGDRLEWGNLCGEWEGDPGLFL